MKKLENLLETDFLGFFFLENHPRILLYLGLSGNNNYLLVKTPAAATGAAPHKTSAVRCSYGSFHVLLSIEHLNAQLIQNFILRLQNLTR